ncbi:sulfurtransferase-like selenium metabolism protein YedF [Tepidibacter formicigenes]|jgi:selenium metabolism protein YedF|uniref:Selenium metabolism protein YedF n=1 Tax=Tepidibacter formicigenes DSM 15518 TaxID=1123349 RepID=A0A1M6P9E8_9FIRM|nr:sulfurtransferase-like selenium metabolism protein YedF [Tepidibacter formicigenes]SHK04534.1 selenium metabolism protein YedF [Tepidibacter formicigenes DSM 15518]
MKIEVDARGLACPQPVIKTKKELDKIKEGIVTTLVDNEIAKENVLKLANSMNCSAKYYEKDGTFYIEMNKGKESVVIQEENIECENCTVKIENKEDKVIYISSDCMGKGSDELGKILIKGFIYTLTEIEPYPKAVIFVNSAVKLTTENEETIEHLKKLEKEGVEILSCGTCLDYFNLKDKLMVGKVSNMYDIVEKLKGALNTISI